MSIISDTYGEKPLKKTTQYTDDGAYNRDHIPDSVGAGMEEVDVPAGRMSKDQYREDWSAGRKRAAKRADAKRADHFRDKKAQRRADMGAASQKVMSGSHFAPYTDHIREAKDKAAKRLKIMKKRSYYEDV